VWFHCQWFSEKPADASFVYDSVCMTAYAVQLPACSTVNNLQTDIVHLTSEVTLN